MCRDYTDIQRQKAAKRAGGAGQNLKKGDNIGRRGVHKIGGLGAFCQIWS